MSLNALNDPASPTDAQIQAALGASFAQFTELASLTEGFEREWRHYGKKYGWKLKVHADDKTLAEVTVADGWFLVAMSLREKERAALQADAATSRALGEAPAEGFFKFEVRDAASFARAAALVRFVIAQRAP